MKKLGLVGAIGQLRHFLVIKPVTGGGRGHGKWKEKTFIAKV